MGVGLENELIILDCTVRDGNYSVEFKFTEADTALLTSELTKLGVKWIEVGHGVGIGAMEAGIGKMPASDFELIRAAKSVAGSSKIGAFYIPAIAPSKNLLMQAREAGLDFIRIGENATEAHKVYSYIEEARKQGLIPCLNLMKTYSITPANFAQIAKDATAAGVEIVYCVDSAGSMLPDDVAAYCDAAANSGAKLGFHCHNNLMMGVSNCVVAYEHGVRHIDSTLCGLGRSAGNAPTEILVAVFERLGIKTGIDLFALMDVIEKFMWPLVGQVRPNDMLSVAAGYSQFHSSLLPTVAAAARKHNAELRRLLSKVAAHNAVSIDANYLEQAASELEGTASSTSQGSDALLAFNVNQLDARTINASIGAVQALVEGLVVSTAKRAGTQPVLHLTAADRQGSEDLLLTEYVLTDSQMAMGRVTYGSLAILKEVLSVASREVSLFLVSQECSWLADPATVVSEIVGTANVIPVRDKELKRKYLFEVVDWMAQITGQREDLLIYAGADDAAQLIPHFSKSFRNVVAMNAPGWNDGQQYDLIVSISNPADFDLQLLIDSLSQNGRFISFVPFVSPMLRQALGERFVFIDINQAYSGIIGQYLHLKNRVSSLSDEFAKLAL